MIVKIEKLNSISNYPDSSYIFGLYRKEHIMITKVHKTSISIILILLSYGFIIYRIVNFKTAHNFSFSFCSLSISALLLMFTVIILMLLNWFTEAYKWKLLINDTQTFTLAQAFKAVLAGITVGIFTPNRVGEIGGRILFLDKGKRTYGAIATAIGSYAQFITTLIFGLSGFILFLIFFPEKSDIIPLFNKIYVAALILIVVLLIWLYFNIKVIKPLLLKIPFFKKRLGQLEYLSAIKLTLTIKILLLSIVRYLIFTTQFFLLLLFFNIHITLIQAFVSISLTYLFATLIPTTTLAELGIRGSLSIFFIGMFSYNIPSIVFSTLTLWFINLAFPAIIGGLFFNKNKL